MGGMPKPRAEGSLDCIAVPSLGVAKGRDKDVPRVEDHGPQTPLTRSDRGIKGGATGVGFKGGGGPTALAVKGMADDDFGALGATTALATKRSVGLGGLVATGFLEGMSLGAATGAVAGVGVLSGCGALG